MSVHTGNTPNFTRHVGTVGDKRVAIIIQDPQATHEVHVIDTDALPDAYHQNLMDMLMTPQAQSAKWFGEYLHRNMFFDGTNALKTCYVRGWIQQVPVTSVVLTPRPNQRVALTETLGIMTNNYTPQSDPLAAQQNPAGVQEQQFGDIVQQEQAKLNQFDARTQTHNQHQANLQGDVHEQNRLIAANLLAEAKLLENDARAKRDLAAQYDPSTKAQSGSYTPAVAVQQEAPFNPLAKNATANVQVTETVQVSDGAYVDQSTGKEYKTEAALKAAVTRRENAAKAGNE